ncbi:MAG: chemotaxis protein CheW [Promethearchaeota archaeon]
MTTIIQTEKVKNRHLIFRIANDLYGLEVHYLKEVFQTGNILKLPRTSSVLEGIVNLRGYIVSIFNLSVLLWGDDSRKEEGSSKNKSSSNIILLVTIKDQDIGILVDQIHQLDTITDFKTKDDSYFQERVLLNPSLISKIGFLENKHTVFILNLEELLGDFITSKKSDRPKTTTSDEDFNFDFDQYTLPDPDELSEKLSTEASTNFDIDQLNLPENLQTDDFDLDKLEIEEKESNEKKKNITKESKEKGKPKKKKSKNPENSAKETEKSEEKGTTMTPEETKETEKSKDSSTASKTEEEE